MKSLSNNIESVTVFAASKGLNVEAMTETVERMTKMTSLFHNGQFCHSSAPAYGSRGPWAHTRGSFGSSVGCGTSMIGMAPVLSYFRLALASWLQVGRLASSSTKDVPVHNQLNVCLTRRQSCCGPGTCSSVFGSSTPRPMVKVVLFFATSI